jgi:excisionase family DNA binding protein
MPELASTLARAKNWWTLKEIAEDLGVSTDVIYRLNAAGKGPRRSRVGREFRVSAENYRAWLAAREES